MAVYQIFTLTCHNCTAYVKKTKKQDSYNLNQNFQYPRRLFDKLTNNHPFLNKSFDTKNHKKKPFEMIYFYIFAHLAIKKNMPTKSNLIIFITCKNL